MSNSKNKGRKTPLTSGSNKANPKLTRPLEATIPTLKTGWLKPHLILFILAFVLYGNTIPHAYALDDAIVITNNAFTQKGLSGIGEIFATDAFEGYFKEKKDLVAGGRYRPLSIATFAVEVELFGQNPHISHFINILLYGLTGLVLYLLLQLLFPPKKEKKWWTSLSFLGAALYLVHPIHSEVVANIKGRDEILALLLTLSTFLFIIRWVDTPKKWPLLLLATISFFLALLSKETALPFLLIFPITLYFFRPISKPFKTYALAMLPLLIPVGLYFLLRDQAVGQNTAGTVTEILNDPFIHASYSERLATVSHTLGIYLAKLFAPLTLSHDYYFNQIPIIGWGKIEAIVPLLAYFALFILTLIGTIKRHPAAWGMWFFFLSLSLVSNVVISVGTTMGERFLYIPSLGFIIASIFVLRDLAQRFSQTKLALSIIIAAIILFSVRTVIRNPVWKNNFTLFTTDVAYSPNSAKLRTSAGGVLIEAATQSPPPPQRAKYLAEAITHLKEAVRIYPEHGQAWLLLGNAYFNQNGQYQKALESFQVAIKFRPGFADAYKNAGVTSNKLKRPDLASQYYKAATQLQPQKVEFWYELGITYEEWNKPDSAIIAFEQTLQLQPQNTDAMGKIAMIYGRFLKNYDLAISYAQRAIQIDPNEEGLYENMGIAYAMKGDITNALATFKQGIATLPKSAKLHLNLGITYQNMGDSVRASQAFKRAFELDPNLKR